MDIEENESPIFNESCFIGDLNSLDRMLLNFMILRFGGESLNLL